jgi:hypothetical protein
LLDLLPLAVLLLIVQVFLLSTDYQDLLAKDVSTIFA